MAKGGVNSVDRHVGSRIRWRRMMLKISQTELGDHLSVSFQQIQKYEGGKNRIGPKHLVAVATLLEVPVAFFFDEQPQGRAADIASAEQASKLLHSTDGLALVKAILLIKSQTLRRHIAELIEAIADKDKSDSSPA